MMGSHPFQPRRLVTFKRNLSTAWIGRGHLVRWPDRSPDLSCLDFCYWGQMKAKVYGTPIDSDENLASRIFVAEMMVQYTP
ncbi:hypothetical protein AVEN_63196-1 [Araneus ventricosus]|uniref:Uncharacterized protein n=1 Tax=Araneus ventricosus TaxID=182803 RepID=A0A4Y2B1B2_ARAVE|nr:hypothetical protein AVEN_63196-1 [Araneus ventricosus]